MILYELATVCHFCEVKFAEIWVANSRRSLDHDSGGLPAVQSALWLAAADESSI